MRRFKDEAPFLRQPFELHQFRDTGVTNISPAKTDHRDHGDQILRRLNALRRIDAVGKKEILVSGFRFAGISCT